MGSLTGASSAAEDAQVAVVLGGADLLRPDDAERAEADGEIGPGGDVVHQLDVAADQLAVDRDALTPHVELRVEVALVLEGDHELLAGPHQARADRPAAVALADAQVRVELGAGLVEAGEIELPARVAAVRPHDAELARRSTPRGPRPSPLWTC